MPKPTSPWGVIDSFQDLTGDFTVDESFTIIGNTGSFQGAFQYRAGETVVNGTVTSREFSLIDRAIKAYIRDGDPVGTTTQFNPDNTDPTFESLQLTPPQGGTSYQLRGSGPSGEAYLADNARDIAEVDAIEAALFQIAANHGFDLLT